MVTQERPAHPGRAALVAALLLAACILLASWLIFAKARARHVALEDQPRRLPEAGLSVRLPVDWEVVQGRADRVPGIVLELQSPRSPAERLILFRGLTRANGTVRTDAVLAGRQLAEMFGTGELLQADWATIGPLPAWMAVFGPSRRDRSRMHLLVRTAIAPDGQIIGLLIAVPHPPLEEDLAMLANVAGHLELTGMARVDAPEAHMRAAGILFDLPDDAKLVAPQTPTPADPAPLLLQGGRRSHGWHLKIGRVPLADPRTLDQVVTSHAHNARQRIELTAETETVTVGDRTTVRMDLPATDPMENPLLIWGAEVDSQTALLLVGRAEPDGWEALVNVSTSIMAESQVTGFEEMYDLQEATRNGRQRLEALARTGLASHWHERIQDGERFRIHGPGLPPMHEVRTYRTQTDDEGHAWWRLSVTYPPATPGIALPVTIEEQWMVRDDTRAHSHRFERQQRGRPDIQYTQLRLPDTDLVRRELAAEGRSPIAWQVTIGDTFGCDPVLNEVLGALASEDDPQPVAFTSTEMFIEEPYSWLALPLGDAPLPGPGAERMGRLVRLLRDYDPSPVDLYFDPQGRLWSIHFAGALWQERIDDVQRPAFRGVPPETGRSGERP